MEHSTALLLPILVAVLALLLYTARDAHSCSSLITAVQARSMDDLTSLLSQGHKVDCQDRDGWTPLCHAAKLGFDDIVMGLLHAKSDPSRPLYIAAESGHYSVVHALIAFGADPNMDYMGMTALAVAIQNTHKTTISVLLEAKANPNTKCMSRTPLHYAVEIGNTGVINILLRYKADPNLTDELGRTALHVAIEKSDAWAVSVLLESGADYDKKYKKRTCLDIAEEIGIKTIIKFLKDAEVAKKKHQQKSAFR